MRASGAVGGNHAGAQRGLRFLGLSVLEIAALHALRFDATQIEERIPHFVRDDTGVTFLLFAQGFVNFFFGDYAFADQGPVVAVNADDGGGQDAAGIACIEDQREAVA